MRWFSILILAGALGGCATTPQAVAPPQLSDNARYGRADAGALAFDPPVMAGQPTVDLSREGRQPQVFAGYEDTVTTYYDIQTCDTQGSGTGWGPFGCFGDGYQRTAYIEKSGVNSR